MAFHLSYFSLDFYVSDYIVPCSTITVFPALFCPEGTPESSQGQAISAAPGSVVPNHHFLVPVGTAECSEPQHGATVPASRPGRMAILGRLFPGTAAQRGLVPGYCPKPLSGH
jgi:hypothetical protein